MKIANPRLTQNRQNWNKCAKYLKSASFLQVYAEA